MSSALAIIARLIPALTGAPAPADTLPLPTTITTETPAPLITASTIDWAVLRGDTSTTPDTAQIRKRTRAVEYSEGYQTRLKIHRTLSYAMIPLFIGSYVTGDQILRHRSDPPKWATTLHKPFALATGAVFTVNTVTGLWNLWDSRKNPDGQVKRTVHSLLFIAATAGFTYAGTSLAHDATEREDRNHFHKTVAMASMGVSVVSWGMMVFFR